MAHTENFTIDQGSDVAIELHLVEQDGSKKDLSSYSVEAMMKLTYSSDSSATTVFNTQISDPPTDGIVVMTLNNTQTELLNPKKRYVYDVEISYIDSDSNTIIERVLEGQVDVTPSVTK